MTTTGTSFFTTLALRLCIAGLGLSGLSTAHAASFCANTVDLLKAGLAIGTLQQQPYTIMVAQGTYVMDDDFSYQMPVPITIEGGYSSNCATRQVDAANTVINIGQGHWFDLRQDEASPAASIRVDGLTFSNVSTGMFFKAGSYNQFSSNDEGSITLSNLRFTQIADSVSIPIIARSHSGSINLENVLIDHVGSDGICAVSLDSVGGGFITVNHLTADLGDGDFCLFDGDISRNDDAEMFIYNSIFWNSTGAPPIVRANFNEGTTVALFNTVFRNHAIAGTPIVQGQINADPQWIDPANGNYRLKTSPFAQLSPAINSGTSQIFGGEPASDIEGHPRIAGSLPDRGAYESPYSDQNVLTVTNTHDSGGGSLRQAILDANTSPFIAKKINFDIRNAANVPLCPVVIALNSTLPLVTTTMAIDGYTQGPSSRNTSAEAFNAQLCVVVKPASGSLPFGFQVPASAGLAASFTLRGVGLGGFAQPVMLLGGAGHLIAGNQLGGTATGIVLPGATMNAVAIGANAGGSLIVGGSSLADRNVIGGAALAGVNVQSNVSSTIAQCQIVNNLIGLAPNGFSALANNVGVNAAGDGCGIVRNRIAANTLANIWLNGSSGHVVQQNKIGFTTQDGGFFDSAIGVLVSGSGNVIGAGGNGGIFTANTIRYMGGGGVVMEGNASGNSVNANLIYDNGVSGNSLDIDLRTTGAGLGVATPNDGGDADVGPNFLQNFPVASRLVYGGPGNLDRPAIVSGVLDTLPGVHRIDAYFSSKAMGISRRGHAQVFLGNMTVNSASGRQPFSLPIVVPNQLPGGVISFTATDSVGNTSEIGTGLSIDTIFIDGAD